MKIGNESSDSHNDIGDGPAILKQVSGSPSTIQEGSGTDTIAGDSSTTSVVNFGAPGTGYINSSTDTDWFKVHLDAGVLYRFGETASGALSDPNLVLYNASGSVVASYGHNSIVGPNITYTPSSSGDYYIGTSSHNGSTGAYSIQFNDYVPGSTASTATLTQGVHQFGLIESSGDQDWYAVTLTAGVTYDITATGHGTDGLEDTQLTLYTAQGSLRAQNDDASNSTSSSTIHYTPTTSGSYFVDVAAGSHAPQGHNVGVFDVAFTVSTDIYEASSATTGVISPGGSVSSAIDTDGDHDWFAVSLEAGHIYDISLSGSGATPLDDPFVEVMNASGTVLASDDDSGPGHNSSLSFYATSSGTYYISAESFENAAPATNIGTYTLTVGNGVTPTVDSIAGSVATTAALTLGQSQSGRIDTPGDHDWYAVDLVAGQGYDFDLNGLNGLDVNLNVYDSNGTLIAKNDHFGTGTDSHIDFEAAKSGRFYLSASSSGDNHIGDYTITASNGDRPLLTSSIDWGTKLSPASGVVHVYFAQAGETFDGETSLGWNAYETQQAMSALGTYSNFVNLTFVQTADASQADFKLLTANDLGDNVAAYMNPPGTDSAGVGVFATNIGGAWSSA